MGPDSPDTFPASPVVVSQPKVVVPSGVVAEAAQRWRTARRSFGGHFT
jgi:hypothetical protein